MDKLFEKQFNDLPLMAVPYSTNGKFDRREWNINNLLNSKNHQQECVNKCLGELNITREELSKSSPYNCGVMFLNLKILREIKLLNKIKQYLIVYLKNGRFHRPSGTQTICNLLIPNYIHIEWIYNVLGKKRKNDTIILHFKGFKVPNDNYKNIFKDLEKDHLLKIKKI